MAQKKWELWEEDYILHHINDKNSEIGRELDRSANSVAIKKTKLKKEMAGWQYKPKGFEDL